MIKGTSVMVGLKRPPNTLLQAKLNENALMSKLQKMIDNFYPGGEKNEKNCQNTLIEMKAKLEGQEKKIEHLKEKIKKLKKENETIVDANLAQKKEIQELKEKHSQIMIPKSNTIELENMKIKLKNSDEECENLRGLVKKYSSIYISNNMAEKAPSKTKEISEQISLLGSN